MPASRGEDKLVERRRKPAPKEEVLKLWAEEWRKEGVAVNRKQLLPPKGFQVCRDAGL
jgi:hypothetical protein